MRVADKRTTLIQLLVNSLERGVCTEGAVYDAFQEKEMILPPWFKTIRRASLTQDLYEKTDFIVETNDMGELRLQVKSSNNAAQSFKMTERYIAVVCIDYTEPNERIRQCVIAALSALRRSVTNGKR
jgi:hypothetical protein